jgi:hypothetical protein
MKTRGLGLRSAYTPKKVLTRKIFDKQSNLHVISEKSYHSTNSDPSTRSSPLGRADTIADAEIAPRDISRRLLRFWLSRKELSVSLHRAMMRLSLPPV